MPLDRPYRRLRFRVLAPVCAFFLSGCFGAYRVTADDPAGAGLLMPTIRDKDVGLVGIASALTASGRRSASCDCGRRKTALSWTQSLGDS